MPSLLQELVVFNMNIFNHFSCGVLTCKKASVVRSPRELILLIRRGLNFLLVLQHNQDTFHLRSWQQLFNVGR